MSPEPAHRRWAKIIARLVGLTLVASALAFVAVTAEAVLAPSSVEANCNGWPQGGTGSPQSGHDFWDFDSGSGTWSTGDIKVNLPTSYTCAGWIRTYTYNGMSTFTNAHWYWMRMMTVAGGTTNCNYAGSGSDYMRTDGCGTAAFPAASGAGLSQNTTYTNFGVGYASCSTNYGASVGWTSSGTPGTNCGTPATRTPDGSPPKFDWTAPTTPSLTITPGSHAVVSGSNVYVDGLVASSLTSAASGSTDSGGSGFANYVQALSGTTTGWSPTSSTSASQAFSWTTSVTNGQTTTLTVTAKDVAGNVSTAVTRSLIGDEAAPSITVSPSGTNVFSSGTLIYFKKNTSGTLNIQVSGTDSGAGVSSTGVTFNALGGTTTGWSPTTSLSGQASGMSRAYTWSSGAAGPTFSTTVVDKLGHGATSSTYTFTGDQTAPVASFSAPDAGTAYRNTTAFTVTFAATDGGSGIGSGGSGGWSLQRQKATATSGSCGTFANDGSAVNGSTSGSNLTNNQTLIGGNCYQWVLTVTDNVGNQAPATSGVVIVDPTAPSVAISDPALTNQNLGPSLATATANGTNAWTNPSNALADNDSEAAATTGTTKNTAYVIDLKTFPGVSTLPSDAAISAATVSYRWWASASTSSATLVASLVSGGSTLCSNSAQNATTTHTTSSWSACTPTLAQAQASTFAARITGNSGQQGNSAAATFSLDWVKLQLTYTTSTVPVASVTSPTYTVTFNATDSGGSGFGGSNGWRLQRQTTTGTGTSCDAAGWVNDGAATSDITSGTGQTRSMPLVGGKCNRWKLDATDQGGNAATQVTSASVYGNFTPAASDGAGEETYFTRVPFDLGGGWSLAVGVHNGEATLERDLFTIPSYGPAQSLSLRYSSLETTSSGRFGAGWNSNLTQYLAFDTGTITWHRADGGREVFTGSGSTWTVSGAHYEALTSGSGADSGRYILTRPDQTKLVFDGSGAGRLVRIENRFGKALTFSWGSSSATATDASGRATTLTIDATNNRITAVTDSAGRGWSFGYTGTDLTSVTDPASKVTTLGYDGSHRLTSVTRTRTAADNSSLSLVWSIAYTSGKATSVTDALGQTTSPITSHTFTYNAGSTTVGLLKDTTTPSSPVRNSWVYALNDSGWPVDTTDPEGWTSHLTYDSKGNVLTRSHPIASGLAPTSIYTYDSTGNLLTETDPVDATRDRVTTMIYNATNDLTQRAEASNDIDVELITKYVYDSSGHLANQIVNCTSSGTTPPANGAACSGAGTQDASTNLTTAYTWTTNDQLDTETDPLEHVTKHQYDSDGNETTVTRNYISGQPGTADQNVATSQAYDQGTTAGKAGLATSSTDALGAATTFTYEALGRLASQTDPGDASIETHKTSHTYDELGNEIQTKEFWPASDSTAKRMTTVVLDRLNRTTSTDRDGVVSTSAYNAAGNTVSETSAGVTTTRTFDGLGRTLTEAAGGTTTTTTYDGQGGALTTALSGAGTTTRNYDYVGDLTAETEDQGGADLTTTHTYDRLGRELSSTTPDDVTTTNTYDRPGRVTRTVVAGDTSTTTTDTTYDKNGNTITATAPYAAGETPVVTKTTYDALDRPNEVVANFIQGSGDPEANLTTTTYHDAAGNVLATVDPKDAVTRTVYNVRGLATKTIVNCTDSGHTKPADPAACVGTGSADGSWNVTTVMEYDGAGTLTSSTSGAGNYVLEGSGPVVTDRFYDSAGHLTQVVVDVGFLNLTTNYGYDSEGRQSAVKDPRGTITRTVYDSAGRVSQLIVNCTNTGTTIPTSGWESCAGTGTHNATWNVTTSYSYDSAGRKTSETAPNGRVTSYGYDDAGRLTSRTENDVATPNSPDQDLTSYFYYDAGGRQAAIKAPTVDRDTFTVTRYLYDDLGRVATEIDNCTDTGTTPPSDPATCTGAGTADASTNVVTSYTYDAPGRKVSLTGPDPSAAANGTGTVTTRYAYDANGRLCRVLENASTDLQGLTDPCATSVTGSATNNVSTRYIYDEAGNLVSMIDGNGHTTTYAYNAGGRMTGLTDAESGTLAWAYDARGNKISQTNRDNTVVTWEYDGGDRMTQRSAPVVATVTYAYDDSGNRTSAGDGTRTITATYDRLNRPLTVSLSDDTGADTSYTYDFSDPSWTDPSGTYTASLDPFGRETSLLDPIHASTPWTTAYRADGQIASRLDPTGNTTTLAYDPLGRLAAKTTTGSGGSPTRAAYAFAYNRAGQRVAETSTVTADSTNGDVDYTYDPLARLTGYARAGADPVTYDWQAVPNRSSAQVDSNAAVTTTFDDANRPLSDSAGGSYASDDDGRLTARPGQTLEWDSVGRLIRVLSAPGGSTLATYSYDPLDRLRIVDHGGSDRTRFRYVGLTTSVAEIVDDTDGSVLRSVGTSWSGELLTDWTGAGVSQRIYGTNGHHDVTWIAGPDGTVAGSLRYDPWGVVVGSSGTGLPEFRFQSSWHDTTTTVAWVVTRWYAPALGRFISEDSVLGSATSPDSRHLYAYPTDPVSGWDPDGHIHKWLQLVSVSSVWDRFGILLNRTVSYVTWETNGWGILYRSLSVSTYVHGEDTVFGPGWTLNWSRSSTSTTRRVIEGVTIDSISVVRFFNYRGIFSLGSGTAYTAQHNHFLSVAGDATSSCRMTITFGGTSALSEAAFARVFSCTKRLLSQW